MNQLGTGFNQRLAIYSIEIFIVGLFPMKYYAKQEIK